MPLNLTYYMTMYIESIYRLYKWIDIAIAEYKQMEHTHDFPE